MYHTFFVILLSVCFAPACEGQEQLPAASAEPLSGAESEPTEVVGEIKVFVLKSAPSTVIVNMLKELIPERTMRIIADDRTNSIIVTGTADQLLAVEALLSKLDGADQDIVVAKHVADTVALIQELRELQLRHSSEHPSVRKIRDRLAAEANSLATLNTRPGATSKPVTPAANNSSNDLQKELAQLRIEYDATNKHAHELAESIRKTPLEAKKAELRTAVQRSFTLRQSLLRAELLEMQTRLLQTQQSLDMRERIADQIVDRRVDDLLNPQLKWESSESRGEVQSQVVTSEPQPEADMDDNAIPGVGVLGTPDENGMVEVTFQPSSRSTLDRLKPGEKVFVSQTLRPLTSGGDHRPIIADGCILKESWGGSGSNEPVVLLVEQRHIERLMEAEKLGALEVHAENPRSPSPRPDRVAVPSGQLQSVVPASEHTRFDDPNEALLDKLQGYWDFQELSVEHPEPRSFPDGPQMIYEIRGNRMASLANEPQMPTWHLRFGEPGIPQAIDLNTSPDHPKSPGFLGIIEITEDVVRICRNNSGGTNVKRPTEFAVTKDTDILELRRRPATVTELEGDWHLVSVTDMAGQSQEFSPANVSFNKDRYTFAYPYIRVDRRIQVYPDKKVIHYFSEGNDDYSESEYVLDGELLTIVDGSDKKARVYHRGHVPFPMSIRKVTEEQKSLWRSAIVDIFREYNSAEDGTRQDSVGKGVVISPKGLVICQVPEEIHQEKDSKTKFIVRFDDSSFAYATIVEEADHGWFALQPTQPSNYHFRIATSPMSVGDQVHLWACDSSTPPQRVTVGLAKVILLDRQTAKADTPVCQLTKPSDFRAESCPVLSGDGELLGITLRDTGDLVLAVPVSQLKTMFPMTYGQQLNDEPQSAKELPDWLLDLQGTWTVTDSPIKVDENSGGQMKEIRIDREHWAIVWTAKPGDPDRGESLHVVRPDEKNSYAIDLVDPSTGKVVYPSLYELNQAGLTFCYGHLGTRPKEIGNVVTIKLTREQSRGAQ